MDTVMEPGWEPVLKRRVEFSDAYIAQELSEHDEIKDNYAWSFSNGGWCELIEGTWHECHEARAVEAVRNFIMARCLAALVEGRGLDASDWVELMSAKRIRGITYLLRGLLSTTRPDACTS